MKFITPLIVIYLMALIGWVVWRVFGYDVPDIPTGTAATFATFFSLPPAAFGLWKWYRERNSADEN